MSLGGVIKCVNQDTAKYVTVSANQVHAVCWTGIVDRTSQTSMALKCLIVILKPYDDA